MKYKADLANPHFFHALNRKFQSGYSKVFKLLHNHSVKKYVFKPSGKVVWIVVGRQRDYLVMPEAPYCHCTNFYIHVINGQAKVCMHLAAQRIASTLNKFENIEERDELKPSLLKEWSRIPDEVEK